MGVAYPYPALLCPPAAILVALTGAQPEPGMGLRQESFGSRFQYTEVIEPGTLGTIFVFIPRAIKLLLLGILVGFGLLALLTASRREVR
jgi:hypothetical protein